MAERVLVTGATGFLGSAVARAFRRAGYAVRVLVRPGSARDNLAGLDAEVVEGDLGDPAGFPSALRDCDGLAHVAADYRLFVPHPAPMYRINVDATRALLEAAHAAGVRRIVYTSSVAVLGHSRGGEPATEDTLASLGDMIGHYKRSKFLAEAAVSEMIAERGVPAVIVNPSAPIGPRDIKPTPTGRMILDAARGKMPAYIDTGLNVVHVDDAAEGHRIAYERGRVGRRYILGGENLSLREILAHVARIAGRRPPRVRLTPGPLVPVAWLAERWARVAGGTPLVTRDELAMARHTMYFSSGRAERELDYQHRPAAEAIADAVAWFAEHGRLQGLHFSPTSREDRRS